MNEQQLNSNTTGFSRLYVKFKEKDKRMKNISYEIIDNPGSGDCLFHSIFDFISRNDKYFINIPENVQNLRKMIVDFITGSDENWNKWYTSLKANLENVLQFSNTESIKDEYINYMSASGISGTLTELNAAAELFGFNGKILRKIETFNCYEFGSFENPSKKPKLFLFFTGPISDGHFRILNVIKPKCIPLLQNGIYYSMQSIDNQQNITISNIKEKDDNNSIDLNIFKCNIDTCSKLFESENGLKIHIARCHKDLQTEPTENDFTKTIQIYKSGVKVIRRIPRGARISVAMKLASLMNDCATLNTVDTWQTLFLFPYHVLNVNRSNPKHSSLTKCIKENVMREVIVLNTKIRTKASLKNIIESKVADGDIRGAIRILSSTETIATENDETYEILKEKHPIPSNAADRPNAPYQTTTLIVTEEQVRKRIFSFAAGSAGGIDSLSPQHLKDLLSLNSGDVAIQFLSAITKLCNMMLSGKVNEDFIPFLYGASLIAFNKKDGGIRPIAVGSTIRRLVSKLCCMEIADGLIPQLKPKQLGFGVKGGSEAAIHSVRTYLEKNETAEVIVKVDVRNAFNSMERVPFLKDIEEKFPLIYPYMYQCYASPSNLFYNKTIILSSTGCQQGDPLGPAIFSLGINNVIQSLISDLNLWYLDDGTLGGTAETVIADLITLKERFKTLGLELNTTKCEAYILPKVPVKRKEEIESNLDEITPGITFLSTSNLCLLGAPLNEISVEPLFKKKQNMLDCFLDRIQDLNPHVALYLLQHSLWIPRLTYLFRCTPLFKFKHLLINMDIKMKTTLETIINIKFSENSWTQCLLPVKNGGIGIRSCEDIATPSFLASIYSTKSLIGSILKNNDLKITYLEDAILEWKLLSSSETIPEHTSLQSNWDLPIIKNRIESISTELVTDKSRMLALSRPESGAWLHALPSKNLGTVLDKTSLRIAISLRIGANICKPHTCVCGSIVTAKGIHGLCCNKTIGRYRKHAIMNGIIKRTLSSVSLQSILEPQGLIREDGKRADGMTIFPWKKGKSLVWDATCVDTLAKTYIKQTSNQAGAAANIAERAKIKLYKSIIIEHEFVAFAVETLGPYSDGTRKFVDELGKMLITASGDPRSKAFFIQRMGIEIQRGNAASIIGTVPHSESLKEIFYL